MNLHSMLQQRAAEGRPVTVGLIGAGKFGSMFLAQARLTTGLQIAAIADLSPDRARASLKRTFWPAEQYEARSIEEALKTGKTHITDDTMAMIAAPGIEVIVDATGHPAAGIRHVLECCRQGKHIVMVNVEADALAGPALAEEARKAGIVYSLAYGDQPALIAEMVDWARTSGFEVVAAGKGTKYLPSYHQSTPQTVWEHFGFTEDQLARGDFNPQMFNSFVDGTKSGIEMAAVANACGLTPPSDGLLFPPAGVDALHDVLRPKAKGGVLEGEGMVEVVSSLNRDGSDVFRDLRWGVYVVFKGANPYVHDCFAQYGLLTDASGVYTSMYKPFHLIGLELGISVANAALRKEATGQPRAFRGDVVATSKRDLAPGETLDGEGGYTVWGKLLPAETSLKLGGVPIGLAHGIKLTRPVKAGQPVTWADVEAKQDEATTYRRAMERRYAGSAGETKAAE